MMYQRPRPAHRAQHPPARPGVSAFRVAALWRYPVKSLGGESIESVEVGVDGLLGDRAFAIVDAITGGVITARDESRLLLATATWRDGDVEIVGPGGLPLNTDRALSAWIGRPVRLIAAGNRKDPCRHSGVATRNDHLPKMSSGGAWHDSPWARISLVTTASLGSWAPARFRANVVLAGTGEEALADRYAQLGSARLRFTRPIERCVVVTRAQPGLEVDREVLRTLHRERGGELGVGALVSEPGCVNVGAQLSLGLPHAS